MTFAVHTPSRKAGIKQYTRRCYQALAATAMKSSSTSDKIMREVARTIKREMACISSSDHDSIRRDNVEAVKNFRANYNSKQLDCQTVRPAQCLN